MFYKPNYCCNCGEKIERENWSFTASRRFCDVCQTDFVLNERLPQMFIVLMALVGIFGIGSYWRGGEKPVNVSSKQFASVPPGPGKNPANQLSQVSTNLGASQTAQTNNVQTNRQNAPQSRNLTSKQQPNQSENAPLAPEEAVYFCGAPTKKGTPCSRRVKGGGRCWQHKGQNALLPPEKLIVSQ